MADSIRSIETPQGSAELPPLRIHHFMIWTALTAAIIAGCMTFDRTARNGPPIENRMIIAALMVTAIAVAGALTISGSAYYWRRHGVSFPQSPGDMLLISMAGAVLAFFAVIALLFAIFLLIGDDDWFALYYTIVGIVVVVGWSYLQIAGMLDYANTWQWRVVFGILLLAPWIVVFFPIPVFVTFIASVLCASWVDWYKAIPHAWTHWCGVAFAILLGISLLCIVANAS
jgi:membrane-associated HD superfamily phosphohydrolase